MKMEMKATNTKQRLLATIFCSFLLATAANAQTGILVTYCTGTEQGYTVANSGKLYFDNSNLQIVQAEAATPVSIPVSIIRKITFTNGTLPLHLVSFTASNEKSQVLLSWKTENAINTSHFVVERSTDGTTYTSIGQVAALKNATSGSYSFADQSPQKGINYYRLKLVDADAKYEYSKVLTVTRAANTIINILPNPATDYIRINSSTTDKLNVKIYTADGRLVVSGVYTPGQQISISQLTPGVYMATVNETTYKLIKN